MNINDNEQFEKDNFRMLLDSVIALKSTLLNTQQLKNEYTKEFKQLIEFDFGSIDDAFRRFPKLF